MVYATSQDYLNYYTVVPEDFDRLAERASRDIDILTHGRINGIGWEGLTDYQREAVTDVCCDMVQFIDENKELLDTPLDSYSINGVSMKFSFNPTVFVQGGIIMRQRTYGRLMSTGLCYNGGL